MLSGTPLAQADEPNAPAQGPTLIFNVQGFSMLDGKRQRFVALEYADGKVTAVYRDAAERGTSKATRLIDGGGATLLPGLIDAHGHVEAYGRCLTSINLVGVQSEEEALERIAARVASEDSNDWLLGGGWNQVFWSTQAFPTREGLDSITGGRPAQFFRIDGHASWVNSAALAIAGIDKDTPDPAGGQILRDSRGQPTGVLIDNAMGLVSEQIPPDADEARQAHIENALTALAAKGLTQVHDADVDAGAIAAYDALHRAGRLPIRSYVMLSVLDPENDKHLKNGPRSTEDGKLVVASVKISADGALGSRGAALHKDYSDKPGHRGLLLLSDEELRHHMRRSSEAGFQVNVHAIGDLANTRVLDEFERINSNKRARAQRHRVEHAQILLPADIRRFADLDVIASVQPTHATSDKNMAGDRLGEERLRGAYAWQTLFESGARLAGGSDFPVEPPDPFFGLHAAVTRRDRDGEPPGGWRVGEALSRDQALALFTEDAAYAAGMEGRIGRLLPGYDADFILVEENFFTASREDLWKNKIIATVVAGELVYGEL
ncbi:MAG: amidohydrolase [Congregibacter sp.]